MSKSILQTEKKCYISGAKYNLDLHHIIAGVGNRKIADKWGVWCWLRHDIHMNLHDRDKELDYKLKQDAQRAFEKLHSHELWMQLFRKSYI